MSTTITVDPLTRIEGHLAFRIETEAGKVIRAFVSGEMFRGIEAILQGRDPVDAQQITQRICGVCSVEHGIASVLAQEMAYGLTPPRNAVLLRNLMAGANYIHSAIAHFYLLSALDFVDVTAVLEYKGRDRGLASLRDWVRAETSSKTSAPAAPFLPRWKGTYIADSEINLGAIRHYLDAIEMRALAHRMGAVFAGKKPHAATLVPGGVTETVTPDKMIAYQSL